MEEQYNIIKFYVYNPATNTVIRWGTCPNDGHHAELQAAHAGEEVAIGDLPDWLSMPISIPPKPISNL